MKHELVELVVHWLCNWVGMGLNLGKYKFTFFLLKLVLAWKWKGRETLVDNGQPREAGKQPLNGPSMVIKL